MFAVFGMTDLICQDLASRRLPPPKFKGSPEQYRKQLAQQMFCRLRDRQLSPNYSAPEFCEDWIKFAKAQSGVKIRNVRVMYRGQKRDVKGNLMFNKKTKQPIITWLPLEERRGIFL